MARSRLRKCRVEESRWEESASAIRERDDDAVVDSVHHYNAVTRRDPANGEWLQTFAVITTDANELTSKVHDQMPVTFHARDYDRWLERGEAEHLPIDLLRPYEAEEMRAEACNPAVGNVRNNGPEMLTCPNPSGSPESLNSA